MYKKIIFIIIAAVTLVSCKKDPTNVAPVDQLDNTTYPKTIADLTTFLTPGYSNLRTASLYGQHFLPFVLSVDHTFCSQAAGNLFGLPGGGPLINNIDVNDNANGSIYSQFYQGVAYMNVCLNRVNYYQATYGRDTVHVNPIVGQALFLRGYYFMQLECYYGEQYIDMTQPENTNILGIPLPTEFASTIAEANLPRSSAYKVWTQIISDLRTSAQYLHGVSYPATDQGRVTEWAADGLLAKAFLFTKQYDSAKVYALKVINNGVNSLMPFSQYQNAFNGNSANEFNSESLFEINVDRQPGLPGIVFGSYPANLQSLTTDQGETFAPTIIGSGGQDGNGGGASNMGNGYCQYFVHDKNLARFGFTLPVYTLVANPLGLGTAAAPNLIMDSTTRANSLAVRANKTVDPRLFVCALEPWVDSCEQPYAASQPAATPQTAPDTIPVGKAYIIPTDRAAYWGWSFKKFATLDNNLAAYGGNDAANLYLLRLADVYLVYAEACLKQPDGLGTVADGMEYINKVHRRAYGLDPSIPSGIDYANPTSPTLASLGNAAKDPDLATNPLAYERYVELFGECGWYFDVC
ncbi:MAG TPA: RagB/SusD family nutrient uptake outer membrane protein, partial [Bacteroidia bacterium]|nr:RagB/SusD family nutrient uptake outer membrane protein [Bacteroidia bacterium]